MAGASVGLARRGIDLLPPRRIIPDASEGVMTTSWTVLLAALIVVLAVVINYKRNTRRLLALYGEQFRNYNEKAFVESIEPSPDERFQYVIRLAAELQSAKGQRAVSVRIGGAGFAIHHINQNGTFSAKGPYFVSMYTRNWRSTGQTHLIKTVRGKGGYGFKPDHYKQDGVIREKGVQILEHGTQRYPPIDIRDFARIMERRREQH
jgi:hypothetical protein